MASLSVSSSSTIIDSRAPPPSSRQASASSPSCISLPTLPPQPLQSQTRAAKATAYCRKIVRNVLTRAADVEVAATTQVEAPLATNTEVATTTELPDIVKTVQEAWDKVEDKYAVSSLAVSGFVALWGTAGVISAIDRLPLVPGVLEVVGIGYTGWFAYKNLIFKPDRETLFQKVKDTYRDIIGSN
ncbi:Protein CURVATURE THYLAKOID 1B [Hirschfeldia incana]|nr:Protein CURVATURE THYLAKOID 1B [Hirschfeldia incana]